MTALQAQKKRPRWRPPKGKQLPATAKDRLCLGRNERGQTDSAKASGSRTSRRGRREESADATL